MSTPRAESIFKANDGEPLVISSPIDSLSSNKIDHYATLARLMRESLTRYMADDDNAKSVMNARSTGALRRAFTDALSQQARDVLHSPEFTGVHHALQQSQTERVSIQPNLWNMVEDNLTAGVHTFANTTEALYDVLEAEYSPEVAVSSHNAQILDRLAKLNITQFIPYRDVYLETFAYRRQFTQHLQRYDGGVHFKPGYPLNAPVPAVLATAQDIRTANDYDLDAQPLVRLRDIPEDHVTLGCPITFYKGQVTALWELYASARQSLHHRTQLGSAAAQAANFDGSAASE